MSAKPIGVESGRFAALLAAFVWLGLAGCGGGSPPPPPTPSLSQTVSISHPNPKDTCIDYNATVENVSQATREIKFNGSVVDTKTILESQSPYSESLCGPDAMEGTYNFTLSATGATTDTDTVTIGNFDPVSDFGPLDFSLDDKYEGSEKTYDIGEHITDQNSGDNPVPVISAESLDGKVLASLNGSNLTTKVVQGALGAYQVKVMYGSDAGGRGEKIIEGNITEAPWQIAFWSRRDDNGGFCDEGDSCNEDIYLINEDRTGEVRLTTHPGQDLEPAWSPDGKEVLFTSHRTGGTAIWRMNADGSNQRDITSNIVERARQADWCSNGLIVVAYRDRGDSEAGIGIIDLNVNSFTPIYSQPNIGGIPEWPSCSPDASEIAFTRYVSNWEVYKMNADGSKLTNITNDPAVDGSPDWSQDGNEIVFKSYRSGTADIYRMNSDGSDVISLTSALGIETDPKYSVDGIKIIFTHDIDLSNPQIYIMNSDGTGGWALLTTQGQNRYPAWRPWK